MVRLGNVTLQIMRDWVLRFNDEGLDELLDRRALGPTSRLHEARRAALLEIIERGPTPAIHDVVCWRSADLGQWLWEEFQVSVSPQTLSPVLHGMGLRKLSVRPKYHAQAEGAITTFRKTSLPRRQVSRRIRASGPKTSRSGSPMVELRRRSTA